MEGKKERASNLVHEVLLQIINWNGKRMKNRKISYVIIGLTRSCNLRCKMCRATSTHNHDKVMDFDAFQRIFERINSLNEKGEIGLQKKCIQYGMSGEPLLNRDFLKINQYVKSQGWQSWLYTNGLLLTPAKVKEIYENGGIDYINISITGIKQKIFKEYQGYGFRSGDCDKILSIIINNIKELAQYKKRTNRKTVIAVNYIVTKGTIGHMISYINAMKKIGVDEIRFTPLADRDRKIKKRKIACHRLCDPLHIDMDGTLSGCTNDLENKFVLGNILDDKWLGKRDKITCSMNNAKWSELPEPCRICDKVNFNSFIDYLSLNFTFYLVIENHKILWLKSMAEYWKSIKGKAGLYFSDRLA